MYSRKSVGPRMEPAWGTPGSCENFPSRTIQSHLLLRKKEIRLNIQSEIPKDLSLWRRPACQILPKTLDISSASAWVAPYLVKSQAILSDKTVRRSAVKQEDLKPYWKSEKKSDFSRWSTILLFTSFSKTLLTTERILTGT